MANLEIRRKESGGHGPKKHFGQKVENNAPAAPVVDDFVVEKKEEIF